MIIHNGNGTAFEHSYMQQMSFVFNAGKGLPLQARRMPVSECCEQSKRLKRPLWVPERWPSSSKAWSLDPSPHITSQVSPQNVCDPDSQGGGVGRRIAGSCQLPAQQRQKSYVQEDTPMSQDLTVVEKNAWCHLLTPANAPVCTTSTNVLTIMKTYIHINKNVNHSRKMAVVKK